MTTLASKIAAWTETVDAAARELSEIRAAACLIAKSDELTDAIKGTART